MHAKKLWLLHYERQGKVSVGECSIIEGLSPDYSDDLTYEKRLKEVASILEEKDRDPNLTLTEMYRWMPELKHWPSVRCGLEMALLDWIQPIPNVIFDGPFARGKAPIYTNGLIWMGDISFMEHQVDQKIKAGFKVIKFKIAALTWEEEFQLLSKVRANYPPEVVTLRVDANGGFGAENVFSVMEQLHTLGIHSIEQPVKPEERQLLAQLALEQKVAVALDESLIGVNELKEKQDLLAEIQPQYLILKPSLHGGFSGVKEWIDLAEQLGIGWWMTSALESNIGLNAVAQYTSTFNPTLAQGLGTGGLFVENFDSYLELQGPLLFHHLPTHE
jgi:L-alanine-DL-glutamate epimerase-like enolase superfamily enzyme